ncbi:9663_t:CDS:1, partial [Funneliformis mosseae]
FWMKEKNQNSSFTYPTFSTCCAHGKVRLLRLVEPPPYLLNLYTSSNSDAISFWKNIRHYNNVLVCISFGANINMIPGQGISDFCIHGQVYHHISLLLPEEGFQPAFAQLYIYDSIYENVHRHNVMVDLDDTILQNLLTVLDECNL